MKQKRPRIGKLEKSVYKTIMNYSMAITGTIGIMALFIAMPGIAIPINLIFKELKHRKVYDIDDRRKIYPNDLKRIFEKMKKQRLIKIIETNEGTKIILKKDGVKKIIINNIDEPKIQLQKEWDKIWRVVIFDIPEKFKRERDNFVKKIKELNFYPLQKSVFVFPYPTNDLIDFLSEIYQISPYIRIIETSKIEGDDEIFNHFGLNKYSQTINRILPIVRDSVLLVVYILYFFI